MATTLADLITLVRQRSNMENNYFVSDAEITSYLNNSIAELDDILITTYNDYRVNTFQAILPSDGSNNVISIPSNFYKLRGVDFRDSASTDAIPRWYTLYPFQLIERNRNNSNFGSITAPWGKVRLSYLLTDAGITIQPTSQVGGTYQIYYVPKFIPLQVSGDTLTIQMDTQAWIEYAVIDCCVKIFNKQNLDPTGFMAEKAALKQRIVSAAKNRDSAAPKRMANTRFQNDDWILPYTWDIW